MPLIRLTRSTKQTGTDRETCLINTADIVRVTCKDGVSCIAQRNQAFDIWVYESVQEIERLTHDMEKTDENA